VFGLALMEHSLARWLVLLAVAVRIGMAAQGWFGGRSWTPADNRVGLIAMILADLQLTVGVVMFLFLSPSAKQAMSDVGAAMKDAHLRQVLVEHPTMMVLAVVALHVGNVLARRAQDDAGKHRVACLSAAAAMVLMLLGLPR
jgi:hypothetical protein